MKHFLIGFYLIFLGNFGLLYAQDTTAQYGKATYYSDRMQGRRTFTGERYSKLKYTAAHASLPMGTIVKITNVKNNKSVVVRINDKCSRSSTRIIDISKIAAKEIDLIRDGITNVKLEILGKNEDSTIKNPIQSLPPADSLQHH